MSSENGLPKGWVITKIRDIASTQTGGTPSRKNPDFFAGDIPWAKSGELQNSIVYETEERITKEAIDSSNAKLFPKGTLCIALYGATIGKIGILGIEAATNQAICGIFLHKEIDTNYLYWLLQFKRRELIEMGQGGAQPNISNGIVRETQFPLAPLNEQRRIVEKIDELFSKLDAGVAALERAKKALKSYRASVLKAAVEGKMTEEWRKQNPDVEPASKLLEKILKERRRKWEEDQLEKYRAKGKEPPNNWKRKYKEPAPVDTESLPELSEGWCWASAEQLSDETRSITYGVVKLGKETEDGVPTLRSSNVRPLRLEIDETKRISPSIAKNYKRTFLEGGEILVTIRGTLGGIVVAPPSCVGYNISREVAMIALIKKQVGNIIAIAIASPIIDNWIKRNTRGIAYTGLNIQTLKEMPIPFPPLMEQEAVVSAVEERLSITEILVSQIETNLKRASRLRQSILKRAFEGKLVPQDLNDEPAEKLLERIRDERKAAQVAARHNGNPKHRRKRKKRTT